MNNQSPIDWSNYFYQSFPEELREHARSHTTRSQCPHCRAPLERRCLVKKNEITQKSTRFRFAWYGLTLFDQGLHHYMPQAYQRWVANTGGYPLPVLDCGFGCVRVAPPSTLLKHEDSIIEWEHFLAFWKNETERHFETMSGISPHHFFSLVRHDRSIVQHHERILLQYFSRLNH
jgi:hypothetical protein